jgi:DNA-binding transcriptional LysR family regulator
METQLLQTFVTVAETGSISGAASRLGYVQSSVSEQLQRLERDLGATLLTRSSTGVALTAEGRRLLPAAVRVLSALDDLRRATSGAPLRVGSIDTLAVRWLPEVLAALPAAERPTIAMDRRDLLLRALIDGRCDVVFLYRPRGAPLPHPATSRLEVEVLDTDELLVVTAPGPRADGWLVTQPGCVHREVFDRLLAPDVAPLRVQAEAPTPDALRRLARQGAGRALLPTLAVADDLADGGLVIDPDAPAIGDPIEIVAVHQPDAGPEVHRLLRRAVDRGLARR